MSYCRFSSDNWKSDVYVYESAAGCWTIHVAGRRYVGPIPELPQGKTMTQAFGEAFAVAYRAQMAALDSATMVAIDLPHAGESFDEPSPGACADRLEQLRALGYHVPQYAISELRREAAE